MVIQTVSQASIVGMILTLLISFAVPLAAFIFMRKKYGTKAMPLLIGCLVYIVLAKIIEPFVNSVVIKATGSAITDSLALYAIYGGLFAAVFEEGGRFMALKSFVKGVDEKTAVMYGIGQAGIESLIIGARPQLANIANSLLINNGMMGESFDTLESELQKQTYDAISPLWETSSEVFLSAGFERLFIFTVGICFSLLIYYFLRTGNRRYIMTAYIGHFLINFSSIVISKLVGVVPAEIAIALICAAAVYITVKAYREEHKPELIEDNSSDVPAEQNNDAE